VTYFTGYEYDARNQLSALTDPLGQTAYYERDALGRERAKALPNGVTTYHQYDAASQVTDIVHAGAGEVLQSLGYTYDPDGQRTMIAREDGTRIYYRYDETHRLAGLRVRPGGQTDAEEARLVGCHQTGRGSTTATTRRTG
jgi:YD repeat-containing protein